MKCPRCNTENPDDSRFCKNCGFELNVSPSEEVTVISERNVFNDFLINNRFKILKVLGKGGMGEILLAEDIKLKRKVALKKISKDSIYGDESKARFIREAQTASQLDHPNICTIFEIYDEDENDYIVMQFVEGANLDQIIKLKPLSLDKIIDIAIQICDGMIAAHEKNIIHRDLKPSNIMIDLNGRVKILDFGLAKINSSGFDSNITTNLTSKGVVMGTVSYMSPEQASGKELDYRTDVFSFGLILYEMIERRNPFSEKEQINTLYNVLNKNVEFKREVPDKLKAIVLKALEKDRSKRYDNFKQIKIELQNFFNDYKSNKDDNQKHKTEVINRTEVINFNEELNRLKTSDSQDLGEIVKNLKRLKASTQAVYSVKSKKTLFYAFIAFIIILGLAYFILFDILPKKNVGNFKPENYFIYFEGLENKTKEKDIDKKIIYLLDYSLNQFKESKFINNEILKTLMKLENKKGKKILPIFKIKGNIEEFNGIYNLNFYFSEYNGNNESLITITGNGKDSILRHQIDSLAERIYFKINPDVKSVNLKKIKDCFGEKWKYYSNLYEGIAFYKKFDMASAQNFLNKSGDSVCSKYFKALVYYFNGNRKDSLQFIKRVLNDLDKLTKPLYLKINSFYSRLIFDFENEVKYLKELKNEFYFSKSVFYELGEAYFHHGMPLKAIEYYSKALEIDDKFSNALNHLGYCYSYIGEHSKAIDSFEKYRILDQSANSFDSLGDGYFYSGDYINAEAMKIAAVKMNEKAVPWSYLTLSDIYLLKKEYNKAIKLLGNYLKLKKNNRAFYTKLSKSAFVFYYKDDYNQALDMINKAINNYDSNEITDNSSEYHWIRALINYKLENFNEFKKDFLWIEDLIKRYNLSETNFYVPFKYYLHLKALYYEIKRDIKKASDMFNKLILMKNSLSYWITFYNYQFFHVEYIKFLIRHNKIDKARYELNKCLEYNPNYIPALEVSKRIGF